MEIDAAVFLLCAVKPLGQLTSVELLHALCTARLRNAARSKAATNARNDDRYLPVKSWTNPKNGAPRRKTVSDEDTESAHRA
jgi:hypothetical protein